VNKIILIVSVVLVILAAGYFVYNIYQAPTYKAVSPITTNNVPAVPATTKQPAQQAAPQLSALISIKDFAFNPATLNIKVGTVVTWTNNDPMPHQIKSVYFNSAALNNSQSFQFTFSNAGEYDYSCAIHPSMKGKIIVTE